MICVTASACLVHQCIKFYHGNPSYDMRCGEPCKSPFTACFDSWQGIKRAPNSWDVVTKSPSYEQMSLHHACCMRMPFTLHCLPCSPDQHVCTQV